jgi:D-inositol-3-phosphate glycosyltransferase
VRKLLWIGDAVCDSGFARCTHKTLETLRTTWDVRVVGINYRGDPHDYPYPIYPAYQLGGGRDLFGVSRVLEILAKFPADVVVLQNDPWNIPRYIRELDRMPKRPVVVGAIAVDGLNCMGAALNGLDHAIFWTAFAQQEAVKGGFFRSSGVVPLGVDLDVYAPGDRTAARDAIGLPEPIRSGFIILNSNRNQPRKRIDLTIRYFADFFHNHCPAKDAYLYMHVCPTGDVGIDVDGFAKYYGLKGRVLLEQPGVYEGLSEADLALTYHAADMQMSTTQGEGWGLTTMEGMACGLPQVVPDWAALGEWARPAAYLVPCTSTAATIGGPNVVGGIPDEKFLVESLRLLYNDRGLRRRLSEQGLALVQQPQFRWEHIGARFAEEVERAFQASNNTNGISTVDRREGTESEAAPPSAAVPGPGDAGAAPGN